jgi:microsomal dipeptidase-like Zn-dependent dipeptidase
MAQPLWQAIHDTKPVVDLHIHPAMNRLVLKQNLGLRYVVSRSFNPLAVRASWPRLHDGGYGAILSVIHLPERGLLDDFPIMKLFRILRPDLWKKLIAAPYIDATLSLLDDLEDSVKESDRVQLARSVTELTAILNQPIDQRRIAVVNAIEGAHSLGGPDETEADIFHNLDTLYQRGVAYITLAHFYPNCVVNPCYPFPEDFANLSSNPGIWRDLTLGLTDLGKRVVERMIELGIIIDLSHSTPAARKEIFDIAEASGKKVPLTATHVGAYDHNPTPYNLREWEVKRIARDGGVVGVIFMPYWLVPHGHGQGLNQVAQTIDHFVNLAGEDAVGLGTDFDGFTTPPEDLKDASEMPRLTQRLLSDGHSGRAVNKILGGNALRVLRDGWGKII